MQTSPNSEKKSIMFVLISNKLLLVNKCVFKRLRSFLFKFSTRKRVKKNYKHFFTVPRSCDSLSKFSVLVVRIRGLRFNNPVCLHTFTANLLTRTEKNPPLYLNTVFVKISTSCSLQILYV